MFFLFAVSVFGCGNSKVTGKVTFSDGSPLTVGTVYFTNGTISAYGKVNQNGEYKLGMIREGDGIPSGNYQIYFTGAMQPGTDPKFTKVSSEGETYTQMVLAIDPRYSTPEKSGLTCEVQGSMKYDITVEKPGPGYKPALVVGDPGKD
jgi:hypothetical protein